MNGPRHDADQHRFTTRSEKTPEKGRCSRVRLVAGAGACGLLIIAVACLSCHNSSTHSGTMPLGAGGADAAPLTLPDRVTDDNFAASLRQFRSAGLETQGRGEMRTLLIQHLSSHFEQAYADNDPAMAWEDFSEAVHLYDSSELQPGAMDRTIGEMAQRLLVTYEPRGDESRVLGALLVLTVASDTPDPYSARYDEIANWSEEVRQALPSETERVLSLVDVFEGVTELIPLSDPVDRLSTLYLQRHRMLAGAFGGMMGLQALLSPQGRGELQSLLSARGQSVADIVTLYLRAGRPDEVRRVVSPISPLEGRDRQLVQATRDLRSERRRAESIAFLAMNLGRDHPDVAIQLCHLGHRGYPSDPTFTQCLAEIYRHLGDNEGALDYYEATIANDPSAENFERALEFVAQQMEEQLNNEDTRNARQTHARAERMLAAYAERYPSREAPVQEYHLSYLIGLGEFNAGNIDQAVQRLQASVDEHPSRAALVQLGIIAEHRGQAEQAIRFYRQALDLMEGRFGENPLFRAIILGHLADAYALSGTGDRARTLYNEALVMLDEAENSLPPDVSPDIRLERGFILYKVDREEDGARELQAALSAAPQRRATYGRLLSFYVGHGMVEPAVDLFRIAFNHSELERMWKIYYSMWIVGLQRRMGLTPDPTASRFLESIEGTSWIEELGRFYAGNISYEQLIAAAQTQGQRAEAYYYEAVLQIAQGNTSRGRELLQQVIETNMMGYYEYEFARLLQQELSSSTQPPQSTANHP